VKGSPQNDKAIFGAMTSLMKAQAYELQALPQRKKASCVYQFNLISSLDGQLVRQSDISAGTFPWAYQPVKIYYSHYVYHTDLDITDLLNGKCGPMNSFWFNDPVRGTAASQSPCNTAYPAGYGFPRSDERHWDNMGFEVLPASAAPANDFAPLASLVRPPTVHAIQLTPSAPTNFRIVAMHN